MYTRKQTLTIANGATSSGAFNASDLAAFSVQMPAAFTGASITFTISLDNGTTFQQLNEVSDDAVGTSAPTKVLVTQALSYTLPAALVGCDQFKIVSASAEGAARALIVSGSAP